MGVERAKEENVRARERRGGERGGGASQRESASTREHTGDIYRKSQTRLQRSDRERNRERDRGVERERGREREREGERGRERGRERERKRGRDTKTDAETVTETATDANTDTDADNRRRHPALVAHHPKNTNEHGHTWTHMAQMDTDGHRWTHGHTDTRTHGHSLTLKHTYTHTWEAPSKDILEPDPDPEITQPFKRSPNEYDSATL